MGARRETRPTITVPRMRLEEWADSILPKSVPHCQLFDNLGQATNNSASRESRCILAASTSPADPVGRSHSPVCIKRMNLNVSSSRSSRRDIRARWQLAI